MSVGVTEIVGLVVGLLLGSFLNVCIVRVPRAESVVRPGSRCVACRKAVRWFDNVPLVSWMVLRGRCRDCGERISWRYPVVELTLGLWFAHCGDIFWRTDHIDPTIRAGGVSFPSSEQIIIYMVGVAGLAVLGFLLIGLIVMDWRTQRLPDAFTLPGIAAGLLLVCAQAIFLGPTEDQIVLNSAKQLRLSSPGSFAARGNVFLTGPESLIFGRLAAVCGAALILLLVRWGYKALRGREGLGLGDVKMLAMVAAFLGFWPAVVALFMGTVLAAGYGALLLAQRRAAATTRLPFGSFLGVGGLFAAIFGDGVIAWYRGLLN